VRLAPSALRRRTRVLCGAATTGSSPGGPREACRRREKMTSPLARSHLARFGSALHVGPRSSFELGPHALRVGRWWVAYPTSGSPRPQHPGYEVHPRTTRDRERRSRRPGVRLTGIDGQDGGARDRSPSWPEQRRAFARGPGHPGRDRSGPRHPPLGGAPLRRTRRHRRDGPAAASARPRPLSRLASGPSSAVREGVTLSPGGFRRTPPRAAAPLGR